MGARENLLKALESRDILQIKKNLSAYADEIQKVKLQINARELLHELNSNGAEIDESLIAKMKNLITEKCEQSKKIKNALGIIGNVDIEQLENICVELASQLQSSSQCLVPNSLTIIKHLYGISCEEEWNHAKFNIDFQDALFRFSSVMNAISYANKFDNLIPSIIWNFSGLEEIMEFKTQGGKIIFIKQKPISKSFEQITNVSDKIIEFNDSISLINDIMDFSQHL